MSTVSAPVRRSELHHRSFKRVVPCWDQIALGVGLLVLGVFVAIAPAARPVLSIAFLATLLAFALGAQPR